MRNYKILLLNKELESGINSVYQIHELLTNNVHTACGCDLLN